MDAKSSKVASHRPIWKELQATLWSGKSSGKVVKLKDVESVTTAHPVLRKQMWNFCLETLIFIGAFLIIIWHQLTVQSQTKQRNWRCKSFVIYQAYQFSFQTYLEDIGFIDKYQSGFRQNKSTDDHLFRLSQSVMESFNRKEHVVAAFLDVEKAFDNVWHNGLRYKIFMLDLSTKMTRWLSDFLVGRVIQVNVNVFFLTKSALLQGYHRVLSWVHYFPDIRQWLTKTSPQTKLKIPVCWWHCSMGC